jgi:hypothetical protein
MIECAAFIGHAYVAPVFSHAIDYTKAKPTADHRFYYVDRRWVDQSDWLDSIPKPPELLLKDPVDIAEYLRTMLTARRRDDDDINDDDDDVDRYANGGEEEQYAAEQEAREKKNTSTNKRSATTTSSNKRSSVDVDEEEDDDNYDIDLMNLRLLGVEDDDEEFYD